MRNIILIAPQAAGKGTQSALIEEAYGIPHISTGDLLRAARNKRTKTGRTIIKCQDEGLLVPQEIVNKVLEKRLMEDDCKEGFILDGYPRNLMQANYLDEFLKKINHEANYVIFLNVSKEEVLKRITGRQMCVECGANYNINYTEQKPKKEGVCDKCGGELIQRSDDTEESIFNRLNIFYNDTLPLLDIYRERNILYEVNGIGSVEDVFKDIKNVLGDK
jgi:adenylate kinase